MAAQTDRPGSLDDLVSVIDECDTEIPCPADVEVIPACVPSAPAVSSSSSSSSSSAQGRFVSRRAPLSVTVAPTTQPGMHILFFG